MHFWNKVNKLGLTIADYDAMVRKQRGLCAICGCPPKRKRLAVDHDHKSNTVRGLLCSNCNLCLGWVDKYLREIVAYLRGERRSKP